MIDPISLNSCVCMRRGSLFVLRSRRCDSIHSVVPPSPKRPPAMDEIRRTISTIPLYMYLHEEPAFFRKVLSVLVLFFFHVSVLSGVVLPFMNGMGGIDPGGVIREYLIHKLNF